MEEKKKERTYICSGASDGANDITIIEFRGNAQALLVLPRAELELTRADGISYSDQLEVPHARGASSNSMLASSSLSIFGRSQGPAPNPRVAHFHFMAR